MSYAVKNESTLKNILWLDCFMGSSTAILGLLLFTTLSALLGLAANFIITISAITLTYGIMALILALKKPTPVNPLRLLVAANWFWAVVSIILLSLHFSTATILGKIFLILQIIVVGGLAYLEGNQIVKHQTK